MVTPVFDIYSQNIVIDLKQCEIIRKNITEYHKLPRNVVALFLGFHV